MEALLEEKAFSECMKQYIDSLSLSRKMLICENKDIVARTIHAINPCIELEIWSTTEKEAFLKDRYETKNESYDYIYAGRLLESAADAELVAVKLRRMLKNEGHVLFLLGNIHHGEIISQLGTNHWPGQSEVVRAVFTPNINRFFTPQDAVELLVASGYENIIVDLVARNVSPSLRKMFQEVFEDLTDEDFNAVYWLIDATRYDEDGVCLRQHYTESVRLELVKILRRIENDIDIRENTNKLLALCANERISFEYIQAFMQHALLRPAKTMKTVARILQESNNG
ncbi:hypothetical protein [Selenomonas sp. AE3005]|uniref:hypothetical protein n=1 Tax=Selenomonas sp. AE3005 TaxID=1485543 RepID=UPI00047FA82E|nr:hypothetical protein [Selenomonas sp. AE3005]